MLTCLVSGGGTSMVHFPQIPPPPPGQKGHW